MVCDVQRWSRKREPFVSALQLPYPLDWSAILDCVGCLLWFGMGLAVFGCIFT